MLLSRLSAVPHCFWECDMNLNRKDCFLFFKKVTFLRSGSTY